MPCCPDGSCTDRCTGQGLVEGAARGWDSRVPRVARRHTVLSLCRGFPHMPISFNCGGAQVHSVVVPCVRLRCQLPIVQVSICALGKKYDCTGTTGIAPPGRVDGECEFPNPPAMGCLGCNMRRC